MHLISRWYKKVKNLLRERYQRLKTSPNKNTYLFFISITFLVSIKCIQFPSLTVNAEVFAESGTNFFINAYSRDLLSNLAETDAGYLPLFQRLIALILVKCLNIVGEYAFYSQIIAISLIAIFSSFINLSVFRVIHKSSIIRFILGITIGLISDYELNTFINFVYYGALFLFLGIFINKEKLSKIWLFVMVIASCLIILSKGHFVIFVPLFTALSLIHFFKRQMKSSFYFALVSFSGIIQFLILNSNVSNSIDGNKFFIMPYYILKTIYYFFLTYKHVFAGYVLKEQASLLILLLLIAAFYLGIRKAIVKKQKLILYFFLIGNFIVFCSLFITVVKLNNNINPSVLNLAQSITNSKNNESPRVTKDVQKTNQIVGKSIFDDKHLANLRSLFISNVIVFLVGAIIILNLFSRRSHQIIILLVFFITSGAFGQIKVEESYPKKGQSFSQWKIYSKLLNNNQYCIPLNHYSFLLNKNCNYLLLKSDVNLNTTEQPVLGIQLPTITSEYKNWIVQAIILINKPNQLRFNETYIVELLDNKKNILGSGENIVPADNAYVYFLLNHEVFHPEIIQLKNSKGKIEKFSPNIIIFGINRKNRFRIIEY